MDSANCDREKPSTTCDICEQGFASVYSRKRHQKLIHNTASNQSESKDFEYWKQLLERIMRPTDTDKGLATQKPEELLEDPGLSLLVDKLIDESKSLKKLYELMEEDKMIREIKGHVKSLEIRFDDKLSPSKIDDVVWYKCDSLLRDIIREILCELFDL